MTWFLKTVIQFIAICLATGLLSAIGVAILFGVFGVIGWFFTGDVNALFVAVIFGTVVGFLFGIGQVIIATFSETKPPHSPPNEDIATEVAAGIASKIMPPLEIILALGKMVHWLTTKDFQAQKPGRLKRALVGAGVRGAIAFVFLACVSAMMPPSPTRLSFWAAMLGVPIAAVIGAVLGAVSDAL